VGVDDDSKPILKNKQKTFIRFVVLADSKVLFDHTLKHGESSKKLSVNTSGVHELNLITEEPQKVHHRVEFQAVWANATFKGGKPKIVPLEKYILTPKESSKPRINSSKIFGLRPNAPLLYTIATSGARPISFKAEGLPEGVIINSENGRLYGKTNQMGDHKINLIASNKHGRDEFNLTLRVGNQVCLTPPMGWNSWYCWSESVSSEKVKSIAKGFVDKGLIDYGWTYINIDDCWGGPKRGGKFNALMGNERFQDMKGLCDSIHDMGLKVGLYSTLWMSSFGGFIGGTAPNPEGNYSMFHASKDKVLQEGQIFGRCPESLITRAATIGPYYLVDNDVKQFTEWGIDYVKYDWNERIDQEELNDHIKFQQKLPWPHKGKYPFDEEQRKYEYWTRRFHDSFRESPRDMVLSLSPRTTFTSAPIVSKYSNLWRTTNDIIDTWVSMSESFKNDHWRKYQSPGHFNDPDMLQFGNKGIPNQFVRTLKETRLTPDEQYTQMNLWSIIAAPLLISCDIDSMDEFTLNLLKNREVIAVNQDPLAKQGKPVYVEGDLQVWLRELEGGEKAIALFNLGYETKEIKIDFAKIGLTGKWNLRDCWTHKTVGDFQNSWSKSIRGHASCLIRMRKI
ncbi:MAG: NPCBM/NEW2 domain-containing protein, partial [Planctomycetes bacterium]|nr:NPCBM/NEW2 domain-containing protein [Planctomycetota bacterium]